MNAPSPANRLLCVFLSGCGMAAVLPAGAQVSNTYTMPPPPGYPASGALKQPASTRATTTRQQPAPTRATRQSAAAVQTPATYPTYPNSYPPPPGYTYPPGYGPPPRTAPAKAPSKPAPTTKSASSSKKTSTTKKSTSGPPPPPKVYGPTGDLTSQVSKIKESDKVQNLRLGELERDVSSIKRGGKGSSSRYDGGSDIAAHTSYVARPGDTLFRIASTHRVSVGEIQQLNRMTQDEVHVGQTLLIPSPHRISSPTTTPASYRPSTPGNGETRYISTPAKTTTSALHYTVKKGDSLKGIALKHKMTTAALASANKIKDANKIIVGQRLVIPGRTVTTTTRSSVASAPRIQESSDTVPLPGYGVPSNPPPDAGLGLTAAPAPQPAPTMPPPAPAKPAVSVHDTHRGILAYRVDRSDTIESIAQQFSTTPDHIREMNRLQAGVPLNSGDEIMVPAMGAVSVR